MMTNIETGGERAAGQGKAVSSSGLARGSINTSHLVFFVVAAAAPLTALATNSPIAISFGGPGAAGAFLVAGIVLALFAAGFTAMSLFITDAGAFYTYITRGLGRPFGLGAAFLAIFSYNSIQISLYGAFAVFAHDTIKDFLSVNVPWPLLVVAAIIAVTCLGYRNIALSANILGVALAAECAILGLVAMAVIIQGGGPDGLPLMPLSPTSLLTPGMGAMFAFTFLSFIGFEATAIFSEEASEPEKTIPRATYIAIAFLSLFYAFVVWAVIDGFGLQVSVETAKANPTGMYYEIATRYLGGWAKTLMEIFLLTSLFAVLLAFHNAVARYQFSLAREGVLPKVLATIHPTHQSPWISSVAQSVLALLIVFPFWAGGADPFRDFYVPMTTPGIYGILMLQILTAGAVIAFFYENRRGLGVFRTFVAPTLGAIGMSVVLVFALANVELITGRTGALNVCLVASVAVVFALGSLWTLVFQRMRPENYRQFGGHCNRPPK